MDSAAFDAKFQAAQAARVSTAHALRSLENLAWKLTQPGCDTAERRARVSDLAAAYRRCAEVERAIWAN